MYWRERWWVREGRSREGGIEEKSGLMWMMSRVVSFVGG